MRTSRYCNQFPMHFHTYVEAAYVISGRMEVESEEEVSGMGPGDTLYTYSDEPCALKVLGDEPVVALCCISCLGDGTNCDPEKQGQIIKTK